MKTLTIFAIRRLSVVVPSIVCIALASQPAASETEIIFENETGVQRDNVVLNKKGQVMVQPEVTPDPNDGNNSRGQGASVSLITSGGSEITILEYGAQLNGSNRTSGGTPFVVYGIGSNPSLNNEGEVTFKAGDYSDDTQEDNGKSMVIKGRNGLVEIATARFNGKGDFFQGIGTLCDFEPMPEVNDNGAVAFIGNLDNPDDAIVFDSDCEDPDGASGAINSMRKALFRYRPSGTVKPLLATAKGESLATVKVLANTGFVSQNTTFDITEVSLTNNGGRVFNNNGNIVARVLLDSNGAANDSAKTARDSQADDYTAILYVEGTGKYEVVAMTGDSNSRYPSSIVVGGNNRDEENLNDGIINDKNQVLYKASRGSDGSPDYYATLRLWEKDAIENTSFFSPSTFENRTINIADTNKNKAKGKVPNSVAAYEGFTPHYSLNNRGNVAFVAGLAFPSGFTFPNADPTSACNTTSNSISSFSDDTPTPMGIYFYNGFDVREVVRNVYADCTEADEQGSNYKASKYTSVVDGFEIESIGSFTALQDIAGYQSLFFIAENDNVDALPAGTCTIESDDRDTGIVTSLMRWRWNGSKTPKKILERLLTEGDLIPLPGGGQGSVLRIYAPMPELRDQGNELGEFALVVDVDTDGDCVNDGKMTVVTR